MIASCTVVRRLSPGTRLPAGTTVYLLHGFGDHRQVREWFEVDDDEFTVPATVNEFWYGVRVPAEPHW